MPGAPAPRSRLLFPIVIALVAMDAVGEVVSEVRGADFHLARAVLWGLGGLALLWAHFRRPAAEPPTRVLHRWALVFAVLMCAYSTARAAGVDRWLVQSVSVVAGVVALTLAFVQWRRAYKGSTARPSSGAASPGRAGNAPPRAGAPPP